MDGLLVVDKPQGPSSHDVVARVRRVLGERRIGHTGTLDPMATGVLPLVLGRATRLARFITAGEKAYQATIRLGVATDTYDALGAPVGSTYDGPMPSQQAIEKALDSFRGTFLQGPPRFSAKKIDGRRSYRIARAGARPTLPAPPALPAPVRVTAHAIDLVECDRDRIALVVRCSAGFYIRSLAHDLGVRLGTGAHLIDLRRTRSGDQTLADAVPLAVLEGDRGRALAAIVPLSRMLPALTSVVLTEEGVRRAGHGRELGPCDIEAGAAPDGDADPVLVRLLDPVGDLVGLARSISGSGLLHPSVILR